MGKIKYKAVVPEPSWTPLAEVPAEGLDPGALLFVNSRYHVIHRENEGPLGVVTHLSIRRNDRAPIKDWRDFQRIKNELAGPDREAVELYPSEARLVDTSNQWHLWVLPEGKFFPFGYMERLVTTEKPRPTSKSCQRDFEEPPPDLATKEELERRVRAEEERLRGKVPEDVRQHMAVAIKV